VMEFLVGRDGAQSVADFEDGLKALKGKTAWTSGAWRFSETDLLPWNKLENTHRQIMALSQYLVTTVRNDPRRQFKLEPSPAHAERARRASG
jgi:hypothetical protein